MNLKKTGALILCLLLAAAMFSGACAETVTWRSVTVDKDTEVVDLGERGVLDWKNFYAFLDQLPNLKKVNMYGTVVNLQVYRQLSKRYPDVEFGVQFRFNKHRVRTDNTAFSTLWAGGDRTYGYEEISMLTWCRNLYALDIGHNPVKKLDFLYEMPELRVLIVAICGVTDITPIASLKHLEYLEIFHNRIEDVSCLKDMPYLMDLNLVKNKVSDITPLAELKGLKRLWVHLCDQDNPNYPDADTLAMLQKALPDCHIDAESTSTAGGWRRGSSHYQTIQKMFNVKNQTYEPFDDSDPENMPEPWRSERLGLEGKNEE